MINIRIADKEDIDNLIPLVDQYHKFEAVDSSYQDQEKALSPLLGTDSSFGFVLVATSKSKILGYMAICFSYSIECGGREAFIDEFYLIESSRGQSIGSKMLETAKEQIKKNSIKTLHLEITRNNHKARSFYMEQGFCSRDQFHLMTCHL